MSQTRKNNRTILLPLLPNIIREHKEKLKEHLKKLNRTSSSRSRREKSRSRKLSSSIKLTREQKTRLKELMEDTKINNKLNIKMLRGPTEEEKIEIIKKKAEQNPHSYREQRIKKYSNGMSV